MLATGEYEAALERIGPEGDAAPTDAVLWLLYKGTVAHHAGRYEESAKALDLAHYISEARYTRRVGTGLVSLITNDRVLPYVPDRTERLLIHYYSALNYLKLQRPMEAAVEARRISLMLERYSEEPPLRDHADLVSHMRLVTGLLFQAAGERNDAEVSYRLAWAAAGPKAARDLAATLTAANPSGAASVHDVTLDDVLPALRPGGAISADPDSMGEVIVLIERGFIAPRIQQDVDLAIWEHELEAVGIAGAIARAGTATCIADYVMAGADPVSMGGRFDADDDDIERCVPVPDDWDVRQQRRESENNDEDDDYDGRPVPAPDMSRPPATVVRGALEPPQPKNTAGVRGPADPGEDPSAGARLPVMVAGDPLATTAAGPEREYIRLALPAYPRRAAGLAPMPSRAYLAVAGLAADALEVSLPIDLSACVMDEFAADVPFVLAKTIARAAARQAIADGLSRSGDDDSKVLMEVVGFLVGAAGDAMERADTRSWSLLPASLGVARLRLPIGDHPIVIDAGGTGGAPGCDLGTVTVEAGRTPILSCRVWN